MRLKVTLSILFIIFISFFLLQSMTVTPTAFNSNECNTCHGAGDPAHVLYTVNLGISQTILNGSSSSLTATIVNNGYQLSSSAIALQQSSDYSFVASSSSSSLSKSLGTLQTGSTTVVSWSIIPSVSTNKTIIIKVSFQGTAINHKTFAYSTSYSKNVYVSTEKIALLQVSSNPVSDSTFLAGTTVKNSTLTIYNNGVLEMDNVLVNTTGNIFVDSKSSFVIPKIVPGSSFSYPIQFNTSLTGSRSISVTYLNSTPLQEVVITITVQSNPPVPMVLIVGSILGYVTYILLFLSVVAGAGVYHLKKYISGRKIRIIHSDLANLAFTMAVIHGVILSLPSSPWFNTYTWYQLAPQIIPIPQTLADIGLELGRWSLIILYIGVISGYYIAKIIKRFGRNVGISIHMLTYLGLILGFIHAILIGTWAKSIILIPILMFISIISVGWLKYDIKVQMERKKAERLRKHNQMNKQINPRSIPTQGPVYASHVSVTPITGITCPRCSTINLNDSNFCRRCGNAIYRTR